MRNTPNLRDLEVLRSLLRVQYVNTASLTGTLFPSDRTARASLARLRTRGLIAPHDRGLAASRGPRWSFWRLTTAGLNLVMAETPEEPVPGRAIERAAEGSLRTFEHWIGLADLYLGVLLRGEPWTPDTAVAISARSAQLRWEADHAVTLEYEELGPTGMVQRIIWPDATVTIPAARLFVELDRSTHSLARCEKTLRRYAAFLRSSAGKKAFDDERPVYVLYVAHKGGRRVAGLNRVLERLGQVPFQAAVFDRRAAAAWIAEACFGDDVEAVPAVPDELALALDTLRDVLHGDASAKAAAQGLLHQYQWGRGASA